MSVERIDKYSSSLSKSNSFEKQFPELLFLAATGRLPDKSNMYLIQKFVDLSVFQASGGLDDLADQKTGGQTANFSDIVHTYWPKSAADHYGEWVSELNSIYPKGSNERKVILESVQLWYRTLHYWEASIRQIEPNTNILQSDSVRNNNEVCVYRETLNKAWMQAMATIMDPLNPNLNELVESIFFPTMMMFQVVTDYGQVDLECQIPKPTMDKVTGRDYRALSGFNKFLELKKDCDDMLAKYNTMLESGRNLNLLPLIPVILRKANEAMFIYYFIKYSLLKQTKGRFIADKP